MARVFIIETPCVNVEKAKRYGELVILLPESVDQPRVSALNSDYYAGLVIEALEKHEFNPKEDYLCLVGAMGVVAVAIAAMAVRWKSIRCLIFNASRSEYVLRTLGKWRYPSKWQEQDDFSEDT